MRNYDRMRLMRGRQIGYDYDGRDEYEPDYQSPRNRRPYSRYDRRGAVEPGRDMPDRDRMPRDHYGGQRGGSMGRMEPDESEGMEYEEAEQWVEMMARPDGGRGAKWKYEDAERIMREKKIKCDPVEFWAAMNAMYSDYYKVAKHYGVANDEFFAKMAEAFICDDDAVLDKVQAYWECIVRH
jgi:hypothetical protein